MQFGGPVWHASTATLRGAPPVSRAKLEAIAMGALEGVGAPELGQWIEWTGKALHIRRRLSTAEQLITGPAVDIRGTVEALERINQAAIACPRIPREFLMEELR